MKKLNIAFIWHFHQPNYQSSSNSDLILPWARLHACKDYLDMLKRMDNFWNLKLNFNFSPVLLLSLKKYLEGAKDIHLKLFLKDENELTQEDKIYILNNYFDMNYKNMVLKRQYYTSLYNKRVSATDLSVDMFSLQEYFDIMTNFNLLWIDKILIKDYPELQGLIDKEQGYTLADRKKIYEIQLDIIKRILEEYKNYQHKGKIEISTSPMYHPILPLLLSFKNKEIKNTENLPIDFSFEEDAKKQVQLAIEKYEEFFESKPKGMWLSEQCVCPKTLELLSNEGINWTVLDEGILAKTIKKEQIRDFKGNLENPYDLTVSYKTKSKKPITLLFADSLLTNLINFGYGNYDSLVASNDMYEKIKVIQSKLQNSPEENHVLTIALDGENCWETYHEDGDLFLNNLYKLISSDETLETVLVDDFIQKNTHKQIENIACGSWINRNFDLWVGEATKNVAWLYLSAVYKDFEEFKKKNKDKNFEEKIQNAYEEILIAQGSDWYWWYGEPNETKNDSDFDFLFRNRLMNVYKILELKIPEYLFTPLAQATVRPSRNPISKISPSMNCDSDDVFDEWKNAGYILIPDCPTSNVSRLIKNIHFGNDDKYLYFRFELNKNSRKISDNNIENQIAIYFAQNNHLNYSSIRFASKNENINPILKNQFSREIRFVFDNKRISRIFFNKACSWGLWSQSLSKDSAIVYKDVIEVKLSLEDLQLEKDDVVFCIMDATNELINEVYPQDVLINLKLG